jgi:hypothetical protein
MQLFDAGQQFLRRSSAAGEADNAPPLGANKKRPGFAPGL